MPGMPGLRGTDHIGLTVPDIAQATAFFVDVLGAVPFYGLGPLQGEGDWMERHLGVPEGTVVRKVQFLRLGHGANLELFEYEGAGQKSERPRNCDQGGHHIALYVDDFDTALDHLRAHGVRIMGEPTVRHAGPSAGITWVYFLTPWGLQMELLSFPHGKAYERERPDRLWHPADPAA